MQQSDQPEGVPTASGATSYPSPSISCADHVGVTRSGSNVTPTMLAVWSAVTDSTPSTFDNTLVTAVSQPAARHPGHRQLQHLRHVKWSPLEGV